MTSHAVIAPKETLYNNYRFRSRLEARWAVFFEGVGLAYEYEPEGFDLPTASYLPDFRLTDKNWDCYVEIKPHRFVRNMNTAISQEAHRAATLCHELSVGTHRPVLLIGGTPGLRDSMETYDVSVFVPDLVLDSVMQGRSPNGIPFGAYNGDPNSGITETQFCSSTYLYGFIYEMYQKHPEWFAKPMPRRGDALGLIAADKRYFQSQYGKEHWRWKYGLCSTQNYFDEHAAANDVFLGWCVRPYGGEGRVTDALLTAQRARFEHGERH